MKLVSYLHLGSVGIGAVHPAEDAILPLSTGANALPHDINDFIAMGDAGLETAAAVVERGAAELIPLEQAKLLAPVPRPCRNIICVGKNYREHAVEFAGSGYDSTAAQGKVPDHPIIFTKAPSSVIGPDEGIEADLDPTFSIDYEGELGVVIGRGGRGIAAENCADHVYGYTIINDVTSRRLQARHQQWFIGKSIDTFCPMGPWLVTADEIADVAQLRLQTRVNGEVRQDAMMSDLIFSIPTLLETLSASISLQAGDIIATGTPAGVGIGFDPPKFLNRGDQVAVSIEQLGELRNPVV